MSEPLPPIRELLTEGPYTSRRFYRWFEGVDRFIGTPPEEGATGTVRNYDVGSSGGRVPLLSGFGPDPNIWSGANVFTKVVVSQVGLQVGAKQVVGDQQAAITDPTGGATVDAEGRAAIGSILDALRAHGLIAT